MANNRSTKPVPQSSLQPEELQNLAGLDPLLQHLLLTNKGITRERYLRALHPEGVPDPYPPEAYEQLPAQIRHLAAGQQYMPFAVPGFESAEEYIDAFTRAHGF